MLIAAATRRLVAAACVGAALLTSGPAARAAEPVDGDHSLRWNPDWPRFRPVEFAVTAVTGPLAIAMYYMLRPQQDPHWVGGILFDDSVRAALRLRSADELRVVRTFADGVGVASVVLVVGVDSMLVPLLRGGADVGVQLSLMDFESFALSSIVTFSLYDSVGRARPSYVDCQRGGSVDPQCNTSPTASFPSGHVNEVFTAARLSCAHHTRVPLYGTRVADGLACARDLTLAAADGVLRIMGDRHYLTDVLAGGAIGFAFGYGVPTLFHYSFHYSGPSLAELSLAPVGGGALGMRAVGRF
ncbi:MAG TPA: phosphatase PAP2 family protein [Polyangiaceae bacterium]|nr:phosphatase PAP2 family protein [Polyangiaceae bacterium]